MCTYMNMYMYTVAASVYLVASYMYLHVHLRCAVYVHCMCIHTCVSVSAVPLLSCDRVTFDLHAKSLMALDSQRPCDGGPGNKYIHVHAQ